MELNKLELNKLLVYFIKNSNKTVGRTILMKYVYLFEYYYYQKYRQHFTDLAFERYKFGPNQQSVVDTASLLEMQGIINMHAYENYYGKYSYDYSFNACESEDYLLGEKEEEVASFILDTLGNDNYRGVLDFAYSTPPMREIIEEENRDGCQYYGRVIDMSKTKTIFKSNRNSRLEARKRLEAKQTQSGSDQEYYANLLDQYERYSDTRRRANNANF